MAMGKGENDTRGRRVGDGIREELATLLARGVKDPGAAGAIVTRVAMSSDLRSARVFVRLLEGGDKNESRQRLLGALVRARGMLRREVSRRLALKHAPELQFEYDEGPDHVTRVEELLEEIKATKR